MVRKKVFTISLLAALLLGNPQINRPEKILIQEQKISQKGLKLENVVKEVQDTEEYKSIKEFLLAPFEGFNKINIQTSEMGIYALSNMAEGLVGFSIKNPNRRKEVGSLLERVVNITLDDKISPYKEEILDIGDLENNGIYLSHLNVILGAYQRVKGDNKYQELNEKISKHLTKKTIEDEHKHVRSYNHLKYRWPADQTVTLYSLYVFDKNFDKNLSERPIKEWLTYMQNKATDEKTGLPFSEVAGIDYGKIPRGCAISWSVRYMSNFALDESKELWENYKKYFKKDLVFFAGFREFPEEVAKSANIDSGPIYMGVGTAATAFGVGAAKAVGDLTTYNQLKNTQGIVETAIELFDNKNLKRISNDLLTKSIYFNFDNLTNWY